MAQVIDWLRRPAADPVLELADTTLPITIRRHARATRLTMRLAPDGSEVRITLPRWGSTRDALAFAAERTSWVEAQLARVPPPLDIRPGMGLPYRGQQLLLDWQAAAPRRARLVGTVLQVGGPQDGLTRRVQRWLEGEALRHLGNDLDFYCQRGEQPVPQLRLSRAHRRWGSCTGERSTGRCIRINWRLIMAPDHVRRSVVAHEVAHLTHFDHSPCFYALLDQLFEADLPAADQWLKAEGRKLYAVFG